MTTAENQGSFIRRCVSCGRQLPIGAFAPHRQDGKGYPMICRECSRVHQHNYLAHTWNRLATLSIHDWLAKVERFGHKCAYCGSGPYSDLDHLVDFRFGGGSTIENCFPVCHPCNLRKHSVDARMGMLAAPEPFRGRMGRPHPYLDNDGHAT